MYQYDCELRIDHDDTMIVVYGKTNIPETQP